MSKRLVRTSAVVTLAVAVGLGAVAPAAQAGPAKQSTRKVQTVKVAKPIKPTKVSSLVEAVRRKVVAEIVRDQRALDRFLALPSVRTLDADARAALGASVADDRALLADLAPRARAATTLAELREIAGVVRQLRPEVYHVAVGQLRDLATLAQAATDQILVLDELEAIVAEREAAGQDVTALWAALADARLLVAEATLAIPAARDAALQLTALSPRPDIRAVTAEVLRIAGLLDQADEAIMLVELALAEPPAPETTEETGPEGELTTTG